MSRGFGKLTPRLVERKAHRRRQAVHYAAVPSVGVVLEGFFQKTSAANAALRVRHQQLGVRDLVHAEPAAGAAGALRIVEHKKVGLDPAVYEVVRGAAKSLVEALGVCHACAAKHFDLHQSIADEQRRRNRRLNRLVLFRSYDHTVYECIHVAHVVFIDVQFTGKVDALAVDHQVAAALLAHLGEHEVELFAVDLEYRRAQLDLRALWEREDRFQNLIRRPALHALAAARAVWLGDGRKQQVQVTRYIGHGADRRTRVAADGLLLDRDYGRKPIDEIDVRLRNLRDEALGKRGQRLHVAALSLGVDRVEGEARFAGTRKAGNYDHAVTR